MRRSGAVPLGRAYLTIAAVAATSGMTAACGNDKKDNVYCADERGVVVDDRHCDESRAGGRSYFLWVGSYGAGRRVGDQLAGGTRIRADDAAARSRHGLPATGPVSNGTAVSGGFGSGRSGSGGSGSGGG